MCGAILGLFHQSNRRLGHNDGIQCAFNSLCALCWSKLKNIFVWNGSGLAHILVEGNLLHKPLNTIDLLSVKQWISYEDQ